MKVSASVNIKYETVVIRERSELTIRKHFSNLLQNFNALQSTYRTSLCKLYDKDIKRFFENARFKISGTKLLNAPTAGSSQVIYVFICLKWLFKITLNDVFFQSKVIKYTSNILYTNVSINVNSHLKYKAKKMYLGFIGGKEGYLKVWHPESWWPSR